MNTPIWITEGDPTGISPELIQKSSLQLKSIARKRPVIFIASSPRQEYSDFQAWNLQLANGLYVQYHSEKSKFKWTPGKPAPQSGKAALESLHLACQNIQKFKGNLITLPLSKEWVIKGNSTNFRGHTEYLSEFFNRPTFMMMYSGSFNVIPLTTHIPLKDVTSALKNILWKELFLSIQNSGLFTKPRIGICGINPHAGENGKIGSEEEEILKPIVKLFRKKGWNLSSPISADSIFHKEVREKFDIIFANYHDQGLIPFKMTVGKKGINLTLGLDFIRVSPDHGTAFDIAGKGIADPESFRQCLKILEKSN